MSDTGEKAKATTTFTGWIYPRAIKLTWGLESNISWPGSNTGSIYSFRTSIKDGIIEIICEHPDEMKQAENDEILKMASDIVYTAVAMIGFSTGLGLTPVLHYRCREGEAVAEILPRNLRVEDHVTAFNLNPENAADFGQAFARIMGDTAVSMALNDLVSTLSRPNEALVNCYRAIEGIRHAISGDEADPKKQWPIMNEKLRLEKSYVDIVRENAAQQRHDKRICVPGTTVNEIVMRSWTIMNRFLEYNKRGGNAPLPYSEFPTLT